MESKWAPFRLYKWQTRGTCFIFGSGLMLVEMAAPSLLPAIMRNPINCGAIAMLVGLVLVPMVSLVTPKPDQKLVEETFACYNPSLPLE